MICSMVNAAELQMLTRLESVRPEPEHPDVKEVTLFVDAAANRIGVADPSGKDPLRFQVPLSDVVTLLKQQGVI